MKNIPTLFLKIVLVLIATGVLGALIWFPQTEGRATNLDLLSIYSDSFIIYVYIASIPFFAGLFQAIKLLGFIEKNKIFSNTAIHTVRSIKYYAIAMICFIFAAMGWIRLASDGEDPAGAIAVGLILTLMSIIITTSAGVFQKVLENTTK